MGSPPAATTSYPSSLPRHSARNSCGVTTMRFNAWLPGADATKHPLRGVGIDSVPRSGTSQRLRCVAVQFIAWS